MLRTGLQAVLRKAQADLDASASARPHLWLVGALSRWGKAGIGSASATAGMFSHKENKL